jgi:hypothetical protein
LVTIALSISSFFGLVPENRLHILERQLADLSSQTLGVDNYNITGGGTYRLKSSIGTSDTTLQLSSFKEPVSNIAYTMSYLYSSTSYGTIDPQTSRPEFVSFTGITQNSDGSATLTGVSRGLSRTPAGSACTASTTLAQRHPGQSIFILSDSPCHFAEYPVKKNDENITGDWHVPDPENSTSIVNRRYVDGAAFGGVGNASETATGTVEIATGAEAAASTQSGSLGRLVLPSSMATSTFNSATAGNVIPVTNGSGSIDGRFVQSLATTTFSGKLSFSNTYASSTFASTTIRVYAATTTVHSATSTYSIPSNLKFIIVELVGGGGGGGGSTNTFRADGGGGGGGYCRKIFMASQLNSSSYTIVAGSGGAAGTVSDGTAGRQSNFGGMATSTGGSAGQGDLTSGTGGVGGTGQGCELNVVGQTGGSGFTTGATAILSGYGGNSHLGSGGYGSYATVETTGNNGTNYGGGGGGAGNSTGANDVAGGAGAPGVVIITEVTN